MHLALVALLLAAPSPDSSGHPAPAREAPTSARAGADSAAESAPAPLLVPGRAVVGDTTRISRAAKAREQYRLAQGFERDGLYTAAIAAYQNAARFDPTLAGPGYRMGRLFVMVNQYDAAVKAFTAELRNHPEDVESARELGTALVHVGKAQPAITHLEGLARRRPRDGATWYALGYAYMSANRPKQAERALREAIRLPPARAIEYRDLGAVLAAQGRLDEARAAYRRAQALDAHDASASVNLGNLERRAGRPGVALAAYRDAERRDSSYALALQGQAQALRDLGRLGEAGETYRRWLRAHPDDQDGRFEAVRYFDELGRADVALEIARDGVRRAPRSGDAHLVLGMALAAAGQSRAALFDLRRAQALFPDAVHRDRAQRLIGALRGSAPDSLRAMFEADSAAHPDGAPRARGAR